MCASVIGSLREVDVLHRQGAAEVSLQDVRWQETPANRGRGRAAWRTLTLVSELRRTDQDFRGRRALPTARTPRRFGPLLTAWLEKFNESPGFVRMWRIGR